MLDNEEIKERYEYLISTLNLILIPQKESNIPYSITLKNCLADLEGDSYTFLHDVNIELLCRSGIVSNDTLNVLKEIRLKIGQIDRNKWKAEPFLFDKSWCEIRELVIGLYRDGLQ